jgi:signal peptidase I
MEKTFKEHIKNSLPLIYLIIALFALRYSVVEPYVVPTGSMEPTLKTGDRLYALKCSYDVRFPFTNLILFRVRPVKRGDVILFIAPHEPDKTYVKRAVGIPGDQVEVKNGLLFVNGLEIQRVEQTDRNIMYDITDEKDKNLYVEDLTSKKHYMILDREHPNCRNYPPDAYDRCAQPGLNYKIQIPPDHFLAMGDNRDHSFDSRSWGLVPYENLKGQAMFIWFSSWEWRVRPERIGTLIQ